MVSKILLVRNVIQDVLGIQVTPEDADTIIERIEALQAKDAVEHSVHRTGKTETIEEAITNAREAHDWAEVSRLETIRDMRDLQ